MELDLVPKILRWVLDFLKNRRILVASIYRVKNSSSSIVLLGLFDPREKEGITIGRKVTR